MFLVAIPFSFATVWGWPGLFNHAVTKANTNSPAAATGIVQTGTFAGVIVGPAMFGLVVGWSYPAAWTAAAAASLLSAATMVYGRHLMRRDARGAVQNR